MTSLDAIEDAFICGQFQEVLVKSKKKIDNLLLLSSTNDLKSTLDESSIKIVLEESAASHYFLKYVVFYF